MHTIRTRRLLREIVGPDTSKMTRMDRETVVQIPLAIGVAVIVIISLAGCQQFDGKVSATAVLQPVAVAHATTDVPYSRWISQAHALAAKNGADGAVSDLSY
jgi:hypothetical protein